MLFSLCYAGRRADEAISPRRCQLSAAAGFPLLLFSMLLLMRVMLKLLYGMPPLCGIRHTAQAGFFTPLRCCRHAAAHV